MNRIIYKAAGGHHHVGVIPVARAGVRHNVILVVTVVVDDARHRVP
jgi:hypothetical protein